MKRYIVISPHTAEECKMAVKEFRIFNAGFLTRFEWGCLDDDHTAYTIINAESHEEAKMSVPSLFREKAKIVELTYFDPMKTKDPIHK
jgi:hypothetical protein